MFRSFKTRRARRDRRDGAHARVRTLERALGRDDESVVLRDGNRHVSFICFKKRGVVRTFVDVRARAERRLVSRTDSRLGPRSPSHPSRSRVIVHASRRFAARVDALFFLSSKLRFSVSFRDRRKKLAPPPRPGTRRVIQSTGLRALPTEVACFGPKPPRGGGIRSLLCAQPRNLHAAAEKTSSRVVLYRARAKPRGSLLREGRRLKKSPRAWGPTPARIPLKNYLLLWQKGKKSLRATGRVASRRETARTAAAAFKSCSNHIPGCNSIPRYSVPARVSSRRAHVAVHMCDCCAYPGIIPDVATYPFRT